MNSNSVVMMAATLKGQMGKGVRIEVQANFPVRIGEQLSGFASLVFLCSFTLSGLLEKAQEKTGEEPLYGRAGAWTKIPLIPAHNRFQIIEIRFSPALARSICSGSGRSPMPRAQRVDASLARAER